MFKLRFIIFYIITIEVSSYTPGNTVHKHSSEFFNAMVKLNNGKCLTCPPGWGVKQLCTKTIPTKCEKCVAGVNYSSQYSNTSGCLPCSRCGIGLYEAHNCSSSRDTVCDDCLNFLYKPKIKKNKNFHVKCAYLFVRKQKFKSAKMKYE